MSTFHGYASWEEWRDPLPKDRSIPGTWGEEIGSVRYVSYDKSENLKKLFGKVTAAIDPPYMSDGSAVLDRCTLTTPDGISFFPYVINPKIELDNWIRHIEECAALLKRLSAKIEGEDFILSDGRRFPLAECGVEFY
jgi:hypothetical protein